MNSTTSYRDQLAQAAFTGRLELLRIWLTFVAGFDWHGLWFPASRMTKAQCLEILLDLSDYQLKQLAGRGLIPAPDAGSDQPEPVDDEDIEHSWPTPSGTVVIQVYPDHIIYRLPREGDLFLLDRELELLCAAGFPSSWEGVFAVLWRFIAPPIHRSDLFGRLRDISAILNAPGANPAAQVAQARELVFWPIAADTQVQAMILAERRVLKAAYAAVQGGTHDRELIEAVRALQVATGAADRDGAIKPDRPVIPSY